MSFSDSSSLKRGSGGMDIDNESTAKAYASITAQLESFTSSKVATLDRSSAIVTNQYMDYGSSEDEGNNDMEEDEEAGFGEYSRYDDDALDWMMSTPGSDQKRHKSENPPTPMITPKRTPLLERAVTPVTSNNSKKTHMKLFQTPPPSFSSRRASSAGSVSSINSTSSGAFRSLARINDSYHQYRQYHDALSNYLIARRSVSNRMELSFQEQELATTTAIMTPGGSDSSTPESLANHERAIEMEFLRSLNALCWTKEERSEGDLWRLLLSLRHLGLAALVWNDDNVSTHQNEQAKLAFLEQLACSQEDSVSTPLSLIEELATNDTPPLVIQRRYQLVQWIQYCMSQIVPKNPPRPPIRSSSHWGLGPLHPDDKINKNSPEQTQRQRELLSTCLSYVLAGKLEDAQALVRAHGQSWRAAVWGGGTPTGIKYVPNDETKAMDMQRVGNPHRFLWKRQVWKNGASPSTDGEEATAICSLLANDVESCLNNPTMRTWERGLALLLMSSWGRLEDEVLHYRNNFRRGANGGSAPTTLDAKYEVQEREQLMATSVLANLTESGMVRKLATSSFDSVQGRSNPNQLCMGAVLSGKSAILEYCYKECNDLDRLLQGENNERDDDIIARLRFITHFTLYLDSLAACTTPIILEGVEALKNKVLVRYVEHLATRPDMWQCLTLYASLLPEDIILDYYPTVLVHIQAEDQRSTVLDQCRDLFASEGLDLKVVRKVVRLLLSEGDNEDEFDPATDSKDTLSRSDKKKCESIGWLLLSDDHLGDALICSNILLRNFFTNERDDKMASGMALIRKFLPEDLAERAGATVPSVDDSVPDELYTAKVDRARSEFLAFSTYLEAYEVFVQWKDTLAKTPSQLYDSASGFSSDRFNAVEAEIAQDAKKREWHRRKTANVKTILKSANDTRKLLEAVLSYPGGWLTLENGKMTDNEDVERRRDIGAIRSRYLVLAVNLYIELCEDAAMWFSRSLDDGMYSDRAEALASMGHVQDEVDENGNSPFSPSYWFQHALKVANLVANDAYNLHSAFNPHELKAFLSKLAETTVLEQLNKVEYRSA